MNDDVCFQSNQVQSKFGLLILLSTWLSHCPQAVSQFLSIPSNIPFLTAQVYSHATFFNAFSRLKQNILNVTDGIDGTR